MGGTLFYLIGVVVIKVLEYGISQIGINFAYQGERNSKPVRFVADDISLEISFHIQCIYLHLAPRVFRGLTYNDFLVI